MATTNLSGDDFGVLLDRAIERSRTAHDYPNQIGHRRSPEQPVSNGHSLTKR